MGAPVYAAGSRAGDPPTFAPPCKRRLDEWCDRVARSSVTIALQRSSGQSTGRRRRVGVEEVPVGMVIARPSSNRAGVSRRPRGVTRRLVAAVRLGLDGAWNRWLAAVYVVRPMFDVFTTDTA